MSNTVGFAALLVATLTMTAEAERLGVLDANLVYQPSSVVVGIEDPRCAQRERTAYESCRLTMMKRDGATAAAIAFARTLTAYRKYFGYATSVQRGRFGPVAMVGTLPSGASTYGSRYLVTPAGRFIDPDEVTRADQVAAASDPAFQILRSAHSAATVWPQAGDVVETRARGGGQRFIIKHPIVDGCHACALLGAARYAYDFDRYGRLRRTILIDVQRGRGAWFP